MNRKQTTGQIIKERLSVLLVILACLALGVIAQETRQFLVAQAPPPTATPVEVTPTPTPQAEPKVAQITPQSTVAPLDKQPAPLAPSKPTNLTGKWAGIFSEVVEGSPYQYRYIVELSQQGNFIAGKSTLEKEDDPNIFAKFVIQGQITPNAAGPPVKITENLLAAQKLNLGSAAGPRTTQLSYFSAEGQEYLEGEWVDRRYTAQPITGTVTLIKQP